MESTQGTAEEFLSQHLDDVLSTVGDKPSPAGRVPARLGALDIVIPVCNGAENLRRCLNALLDTLTGGDTVWLIDDASEDEAVSQLTCAFGKKWPDTRYIRNSKKLGFFASSNKGIALTERDIVLLNSDAEPYPGWLEHLQHCMRRNPQAGIVCPLSNRSAIPSVLPETEREHWEHFASAASAATVGDVQVPTASRNCMLLRRECLRQVGDFRRMFAAEYGEEYDLSMRALRAGWDIYVADRACVFHHSGASFASEHSSLLKARREESLNHIWPEFQPLVMSWWRDNPLRVKTEQVCRHGDHRPSVLHVLHRRFHIGGTERVARSLIAALAARYYQTLVYPGAANDAWCDVELRDSGNARELMVNSRWIRPSVKVAGHGSDLTCPQSERTFARLLLGSDARIVHFHHLMHWDTLLLPALASKLGCLTVISVHDFWFNCPIHNQLEYSTGEPCGCSHAIADARCTRCLHAYCDGTLHAGAGARGCDRFVALRYALISNALQRAQAVIVPSRFMLDRVRSAFPNIESERLLLEPHGTEVPNSLCKPSKEEGYVVAFFGGDEVMKGARIVLHLAASLLGSPVRFKIFGRIKGYDSSALPSNVNLVGFYNPGEVGACLSGVDLALLPSFYEESFSMIASECWAHGVPVLASSRGALQQRVIPGTNGWLVPDMKLESWLQSLRAVLKGNKIERCRKELASQKIVSIAEWSLSIDRLYQRLLGKSKSSAVKRDFGRKATAFSGILQNFRSETINRLAKTSGDHYLGVMRDGWGTAGYRVRFPLEDMQRANLGRSFFHVVRKDGFALDAALTSSRAGHLVIQPFLSDEGLRMMEYLHRESGFDVALVIDDLWTHLHPDNPVRRLLPKDVRQRIAYAASLSQILVFTTHELERRMNLDHANTWVINNALPDWIWKFPGDVQASQQRRLRIGWSGAPQHDADLRFLSEVMIQTRDLADWVFFGARPPGLEALATEVIPMVPFNEYPARLQSLNLDLALAPLTDTPFNRCKSHLKILEYGALGLPVIASDLEPYKSSPAILAGPDDCAEWTEKIRMLLQNEEYRLWQGSLMKKWVFENHMSQNRRSDWRHVLGRNILAKG